MSLDIRCKQILGAGVLSAKGEIDLSNANAFGAAIVSLLANSPNLVLDLSRVEFGDVSGIRRLVRGYHSSRQIAGRVVVINGSDSTQRFLEIAYLDKVLEFQDSVKNAVRSLQTAA